MLFVLGWQKEKKKYKELVVVRSTFAITFIFLLNFCFLFLFHFISFIIKFSTGLDMKYGIKNQSPGQTNRYLWLNWTVYIFCDVSVSIGNVFLWRIFRSSFVCYFFVRNVWIFCISQLAYISLTQWGSMQMHTNTRIPLFINTNARIKKCWRMLLSAFHSKKKES